MEAPVIDEALAKPEGVLRLEEVPEVIEEIKSEVPAPESTP